MRRRTCAAVLLCGPLVAGCGTARRVNFTPHTRPASPLEVSVYVGDGGVVLDPSKVSPGPVEFDITNQAAHARELWLTGVGGNCTLGTSGPVATGQTAQFKVQLPVGDYTIGPCRRRGAPGTDVAVLHVSGTARTGDNELTQP